MRSTIVKGDAVEFTWSDNDEMDEACGKGWAELRTDGTLEGQISLRMVPCCLPQPRMHSTILRQVWEMA